MNRLVTGLALIAAATVFAPAAYAATATHCPNGRVGVGRYAVRSSHLNVRGVACPTVRDWLRQAFMWRWAVIAWGNPNAMLQRKAPRDWGCTELKWYSSTGNRYRQDEGTPAGSVTRCTAPKRSFTVTAGKITRWQQVLGRNPA